MLPEGAYEFDAGAAQPADWAAVHSLRRAVHAALGREDPPEPDASLEARWRQPDPFYEEHHLVRDAEGAAVSLLRLSAVRPGTPEYESNRHNVWFDISVLPGRRRQGIARAWLPLVTAFTQARGARLLSTDSESDDGSAFLEALGAEARFTGWESRLWLERARWDLLDQWRGLQVPGVRLELYEPFPPEEIWEAYANGYTELERHVPREGLEIGDWILTPKRMRSHRDRLVAGGRQLHVLAAWDDEGLAGLTELVTSKHEPEAIEQELTAVHPRARGRGLARLLKARLLLDVRPRFQQARYVRTWNAGSNDAMWGINAAMGFERYRRETGYQVQLEVLRGRLQ